MGKIVIIFSTSSFSTATCLNTKQKILKLRLSPLTAAISYRKMDILCMHATVHLLRLVSPSSSQACNPLTRTPTPNVVWNLGQNPPQLFID
jgi:hypothetical protein